MADAKKQNQVEDSEKIDLPGLVGLVKERFKRAEDDRLPIEQRWLQAYRAYRAEYGDDVQFPDPDQSKIYIKITKTKVIAAYGHIIDVLFGSNKFPLAIEPTKDPIGVEEFAYFDSQDANSQQNSSNPGADIYGYAGDGRQIPPGATAKDLIGGLKNNPLYNQVNWKAGTAADPTKQIQIEPALMAARKMQKVIHDQLDETQAQNVLRAAVFEQVLLGTGLVKGPFNYNKTYHNWVDNDGTRIYQPISKTMPRLEQVSVWNFYPDPSALCMDDLAWAIERHRMTESQLRDLMKRPFFKPDAIETVITLGPNYEKRGFENIIRNIDRQETVINRYEVFEYWGVMDKRFLEEIGIDVSDVDSLDEVPINAWVCGNEILRVVLNPFTPARIPYFVCPYEVDPYSIWGVGLPENMEDSQQMMNGHARMAVDNLRFAGHLVLDVNEAMLEPGQNYKIHPGKVFRRSEGQPGQAVHGIKFPSTAVENMQIFDKFRQIADEETGIPSYSHGSTGVQSTTRTASGMSMLMGAAALNIKTVIKNLDEYLLRPLGEAMFQWNMQFNEEKLDIRGDLEVKARGTSALMQKEVRSQRLMMLLNVGTNPQVAPFIKWHTVLYELADALDIDPEKMIAKPEEAALYALIVGMQNAQRNGDQTSAPGQSPGLGAPGTSLAGLTPTDPTGSGGGTIGTGSVPRPRESGFSSSNASAEGAGAETV